jgi:hypothetical protein
MDKPNRQPSITDLWKLILAVIGLIAVIQELAKPKEEREWHGKVAELIPYDFRMPTVDRFRETYWNPDGPILSGKVFGVGWAPNFGSLNRLLASLGADADQGGGSSA